MGDAHEAAHNLIHLVDKLGAIATHKAAGTKEVHTGDYEKNDAEYSDKDVRNNAEETHRVMRRIVAMMMVVAMVV